MKEPSKFQFWIRFLAGIGCVLLAIPVALFASESEKEQKKKQKPRIAVMQLKASGIGVEEAEALTERLRAELVKLDRFVVMEREQMDLLFKEHKFNMIGVVDEEEMVKLGKMIGVKFIVTGSVRKFGETYTVMAKMVDVETAKIIKSTTEDVRTDQLDILLTHVMGNVARKLAGLIVEKSSHFSAPPQLNLEPLKTLKEGNLIEDIESRLAIYPDFMIKFRDIFRNMRKVREASSATTRKNEIKILISL
jgi:TolB-like protein